MKVLNALVALLLVIATAAVGMLFIGTQEDHILLLKQNFWVVLGIRLLFASAIGLIAAAFWWLMNWLLQKAEFVQEIGLRKTAFLLMVSVMSGSLLGALLFCLP